MKPSCHALRSAFSCLVGAGAAPLALAAAIALGACEDDGQAAAPSLAPADASATTLAAVGAQLVAARGCAACHQSSEATAGVLSGQTLPLPGTQAYGRNLTPDPETGVGAWSDDALLRAIRGGVDDEGAALCPTMPRFSDVSEAEGAAIVAYLRSLPPVIREVPESVCGITADGGSEDGGVAPRGDEPGGEGGVANETAPPDGGDGGTASPAGNAAGSASAEAGTCAWLPPTASGDCHGCSVPERCNPNGCYGGYWCAPETHLCHRKPPACP